RRAGRSGRSRSKRLPRDPYELERVVVERLAVEAAVQRLDLEARDVDQSLAFGFRHPPDPQNPDRLVAATPRELDAAVRGHVVVHLPEAVRVLEPAIVKRRGDQRAEGEDVPGEAAARAQRGGHPLEHASPVVPRWEVEERPERADDQVDRLLERELADDALAELERKAGSALSCDREHGRRAVDADHALSRLARDRDRHATTAHGRP